MSREVFRQYATKTSIMITILWIPSVLILYFTLGKKIKELLFYRKKKYISQRKTWRISFDYSKNNWKYIIWKDSLLFDLKFSKASWDSIHIYKDPPSIEWLTVVPKKESIKEIKDASKYEMSSRSDTPQEWELVVLKNIYGNYCVIKIIDVKDRTRSDDKDEITFEYCINVDWYTDFSD